MARSWAEFLGEDGAAPETEEERRGLFGRLRESLGKSRRALTEQLAAAAFDPGDERWLERARRFAVHALAQAQASPARYSLFTGDIGVALFAAACLDGDARFPVVDWH